jgi:hypothetical protein
VARRGDGIAGFRDWPLGGACGYSVVPSRIVSTVLLHLLQTECKLVQVSHFKFKKSRFEGVFYGPYASRTYHESLWPDDGNCSTTSFSNFTKILNGLGVAQRSPYASLRTLGFVLDHGLNVRIFQERLMVTSCVWFHVCVVIGGVLGASYL